MAKDQGLFLKSNVFHDLTKNLSEEYDVIPAARENFKRELITFYSKFFVCLATLLNPKQTPSYNSNSEHVKLYFHRHPPPHNLYKIIRQYILCYSFQSPNRPWSS